MMTIYSKGARLSLFGRTENAGNAPSLSADGGTVYSKVGAIFQSAGGSSAVIGIQFVNSPIIFMAPCTGNAIDLTFYIPGAAVALAIGATVVMVNGAPGVGVYPTARSGTFAMDTATSQYWLKVSSTGVPATDWAGPFATLS